MKSRDNFGNRQHMDIQQMFDQLPLPRLWRVDDDNNSSDTSCWPQLRLLVAADLNLRSAAALAEHMLTLQSSQLQQPATSPWSKHPDTRYSIDLILACGPFGNESDLAMYQSKRSRRRQQSPPSPSSPTSLPCCLTRSHETTAALEGYTTAVLSQLETIVCRVLWIPCPRTDALTLLQSTSSSSDCARLTPNARNLHNLCLPIAPGLQGLGYSACRDLDEHVRAMKEAAATRRRPSPHQQQQHAYQDDDDDEEDADDAAFALQDAAEQLLVEQASHGGLSLSDTVTRLLKAAAMEEPLILEDGSSKSRVRILPQQVLLSNVVAGSSISSEESNNAVMDDDTLRHVTGPVEFVNGRPPWCNNDDDDNDKVALPINTTAVLPVRDADLYRHHPALCLHVDAAAAALSAPAGQHYVTTADDSINVLHPGSLRQRGEFALVTLELRPLLNNDDQATVTTTTTTATWRVQHVDLCRVDDYVDEEGAE